MTPSVSRYICKNMLSPDPHRATFAACGVGVQIYILEVTYHVANL